MDEWLGLAALLDQSPYWFKSPWYLRLIGKPKFRSWMYVKGEWVYSSTKPVVSYGGINRTSKPMWRTGYFNA